MAWRISRDSIFDRSVLPILSLMNASSRGAERSYTRSSASLEPPNASRTGESFIQCHLRGQIPRTPFGFSKRCRLYRQEKLTT